MMVREKIPEIAAKNPQMKMVTIKNLQAMVITTKINLIQMKKMVVLIQILMTMTSNQQLRIKPILYNIFHSRTKTV